MSHDVIGQIVCYLAAIDGDGAFADGAAAVGCMRTKGGICGEIPEQDISTPVAGCADDNPSDGLCDSKLIVVRFVDDHLLGEIKILARVSIMGMG